MLEEGICYKSARKIISVSKLNMTLHKRAPLKTRTWWTTVNHFKKHQDSRSMLSEDRVTECFSQTNLRRCEIPNAPNSCAFPLWMSKRSASSHTHDGRGSLLCRFRSGVAEEGRMWTWSWSSVWDRTADILPCITSRQICSSVDMNS